MKATLSKIIVMAGIALAVAACSLESSGEFKHAYYVNNSEFAVKVTAIIKDSIDEPDYSYFRSTRYEKEIENGDKWYPNFIDPPPYFKIEFFSEPKVCLVFDGDAKIGENDIRYWENYTLVSTAVEKPSPEHTNYYYDYNYYITPDLMQQATEENCNL
jgi:hypothetical protein